MKKYTYLFYLFSFFGTIDAKLALVKVPVADVFGPGRVYDKSNPSAGLPFAPDKNPLACRRLHQLKFNEVVSISHESPQVPEVKVEVSNLFYRGNRGKKNSSFSISKKDIILFDELPASIHKEHIPAAVRLTRPMHEYNQNVLTLRMPWFDTKTKETYSAGTRFVRALEQDTAMHCAVYVIDTKNLVEHVSFIPKRCAVVKYPKTPAKAIELFISILKHWAHCPKELSPMSLVVCSFKKCSKP